MSCLGLVLIALGTGGIKPCVVAFGAEQFTLPQQQREITTFFGIFYACINLGSMISTILTPWFRELYCLGEECYVLAFGVPAVLMVIAIGEHYLSNSNCSIGIFSKFNGFSFLRLWQVRLQDHTTRQKHCRPLLQVCWGKSCMKPRTELFI